MSPWIGMYHNTSSNVTESIQQNADGSVSAFNEASIPTATTISGNTINAWGLPGTRDPVTGNILWSNGQGWVPLNPPAAVTSPAAVAAAVTTPTDFFSGTTFGISNLALVGIAVVGMLYISSGGGRR